MDRKKNLINLIILTRGDFLFALLIRKLRPTILGDCDLRLGYWGQKEETRSLCRRPVKMIAILKLICLKLFTNDKNMSNLF